MTARIIGTGCCIPEKKITNADMERLVDTTDEWISSRTGIKERHLTEEGTTAMAVEASKAALLNAGMQADQIDLIIVGTSTGDKRFPSTACEVQSAIGADHAVCFDLSAACSGFLFVLDTAYMYMMSGRVKRALVIGSDTMSKTVDWTDRRTCILFGDGAGAAVLEADEEGICGIITGSNGAKGPVLSCENGSYPTENPITALNRRSPYITMDGQEVFKFAVKTVPDCIMQLLEQTGTETDEIKYFVLHQANKRIIESVAKRMKTEIEKFPMNLQDYGNTSAATIPVLLDELNRTGKLKRGDKLVLSGFGGGLTWGAALIIW